MEESEVVAAIAAGAIARGTYVAPESGGDWQLVESVPAFDAASSDSASRSPSHSMEHGSTVPLGPRRAPDAPSADPVSGLARTMAADSGSLFGDATGSRPTGASPAPSAGAGHPGSGPFAPAGHGRPSGPFGGASGGSPGSFGQGPFGQGGSPAPFGPGGPGGSPGPFQQGHSPAPFGQSASGATPAPWTGPGAPPGAIGSPGVPMPSSMVPRTMAVDSAAIFSAMSQAGLGPGMDAGPGPMMSGGPSPSFAQPSSFGMAGPAMAPAPPPSRAPLYIGLGCGFLFLVGLCSATGVVLLMR